MEEYTMAEMGWFAWIVVGIVAGWIAEQLTGRRHGLITNLIVGIVGAFVGGWLADTMGFADDLPFGTLVNNLIIATGGAVILLLVFGLVRRRA
jgi:uncharacterized membrane protein YeaQ/YmgE (transglycosylase-associated protein family)